MFNLVSAHSLLICDLRGKVLLQNKNIVPNIYTIILQVAYMSHKHKLLFQGKVVYTILAYSYIVLLIVLRKCNDITTVQLQCKSFNAFL